MERPLLEAQLKAVDACLEQGLVELRWASPHAAKSAFLSEATELVGEAHGALREVKGNMRAIDAVLKRWAETPLMVRRAAKTFAPDVYCEEHTSHIEARYKVMAEGAKDISKLLLASNAALKVSKTSAAWRAYVDFVNDTLVEGIAKTIVASLNFLLRMIQTATVGAHLLDFVSFVSWVPTRRVHTTRVLPPSPSPFIQFPFPYICPATPTLSLLDPSQLPPLPYPSPPPPLLLPYPSPPPPLPLPYPSPTAPTLPPPPTPPREGSAAARGQA